MEIQKINRIKIALIENGKTGKWLAEQLGKNEATVSRWCSNKMQPSLETLFKISELLNIDVKDLLTGRPKTQDKWDLTVGWQIRSSLNDFSKRTEILQNRIAVLNFTAWYFENCKKLSNFAYGNDGGESKFQSNSSSATLQLVWHTPECAHSTRPFLKKESGACVYYNRVKATEEARFPITLFKRHTARNAE